jgi:hypothetical protein
MKKLITLILLILTVACSGQVKSEYEAFWDASPDAADYLVFIEVLQDTTLSQLADSLDWNVAGLTITAVTSNLVYSKEFINDGKYLRVGIVSRNASGIYGMMKVSGFFKKGTIPEMVGNVSIRKK